MMMISAFYSTPNAISSPSEKMTHICIVALLLNANPMWVFHLAQTQNSKLQT